MTEDNTAYYKLLLRKAKQEHLTTIDTMQSLLRITRDAMLRGDNNIARAYINNLLNTVEQRRRKVDVVQSKMGV